MSEWRKDKKFLLAMILLTGLIFGQIILFIIYFNHGQIVFLKYVGYGCWLLSALLGWWPIYQFKKEGQVAKGQSYTQTTKLVSSGLYAIVRHPQYLAGIFLVLAFMLIAQHWSLLIVGLLVSIILYQDMFQADQAGLKKFGREYYGYMRQVPRANLVAGLWRYFKKNRLQV